MTYLKRMTKMPLTTQATLKNNRTHPIDGLPSMGLLLSLLLYNFVVVAIAAYFFDHIVIAVIEEYKLIIFALEF